MNKTLKKKSDSKNRTDKLYDTREKRLKTLKQKGNIITFKVPFMWKGVSYSQIDITHFKVEKSGACMIIGYTRDTPRFETIDNLISAIDWDIMEKWHAVNKNF